LTLKGFFQDKGRVSNLWLYLEPKKQHYNYIKKKFRKAETKKNPEIMMTRERV
jgi:hypothetical protein